MDKDSKFNIFGGLEDLGFNNVSELKVFEKDKEKDKEREKNSAPGQEQPAAKTDKIITKRKYDCPVCGKQFENYYVRSTKVRLVKTDTDLRSYFEPFDPLYYDAVLCPHCGYAATITTFKTINDRQADLVKKNITPLFKSKDYPEVYTHDDALERYKFALLNAVVIKSKPSVKAYICLKMAWISRDKGDEISEKGYLEHAHEGFTEAYGRESFPICNMDEPTFTYLLAELSRRTGRLDEAGRYISKLVVNRSLTPRLRMRVDEVRDLVKEDKKRFENK